MSRLSVVVPAYNEQEAIGQVLQRIVAVSSALRREAGVSELEVLVVDDGSTDGTARAVEEFWAGARHGSVAVRLIRHAVNRGYGAALQTGFAAARGSLLAFLDGDRTYPPESLPALCRAALRPGVALVLGDRMSAGAWHMPMGRRLGNAAFALLASLLSGTRVADCCSGMRVLHASTWRQLGPLPAGLEFSPTMTLRALHRGLALEQVAIPYYDRVGSSKLRVVQDGVRFLAAILGETWRHRPARVCGLVGAAGASFLGLAGALALLALHRSPCSRLGASLLLGAPLLGALALLLTAREPGSERTDSHPVLTSPDAAGPAEGRWPEELAP
ncbi:MAG: glycosyltransferase family 2 protein [Anaerolineae bacterium]|nr:glycosyltransferase family 2 protein [Anaerolineae bacterium]